MSYQPRSVEACEEIDVDISAQHSFQQSVVIHKHGGGRENCLVFQHDVLDEQQAGALNEQLARICWMSSTH